MSRCSRSFKSNGKKGKRKKRERNLHPDSILIFSREAEFLGICVRHTGFDGTPLEDSRRLYLRHLARGINYRGGFTPVTVLPDRYPPSIRIKAGKGERERESCWLSKDQSPPRSEDTESIEDTSTSCSPRFSSPIRYQALPLPRLMQILRKLLALRAFVSPRLASTTTANPAETIPRETRLS